MKSKVHDPQCVACSAVLLAGIVWAMLGCIPLSAEEKLDALVNRGAYAQATAAAESLVAEHPRDIHAAYTLGALYRRSGRLNDARGLFERLIDLYNNSGKPNAADALDVARGCEELHLFQDAITVLDDVLAADPKNADAQAEIGRIFRLNFRPEDATKRLTQALKLKPGHPQATVELAYLEAARDNGAGAVKSVEALLAKRADFPAAHEFLAAQAVRENQFAEAVRRADAGLAVNAESLALRAWRAVALAMAGDTAGWDADVQKLRAANPRYGYHDYLLGTELRRRRSYVRAEEALRRSVDADPSNGFALAALGGAQMDIGREAEGRQTLERARTLNQFDFFVSNLLNLLGRMEQFKTEQTALFTIRCDPSDEAMLPLLSARLDPMARDILSQFGVKQRIDATVEIFPNLADFGTRSLGLPVDQGTVATSTSRVIAMASPRLYPARFNWLETIRHEFVHVVTLSVAQGNLPPWLAEGMAAAATRDAVPLPWERALSEALAQDRLIPLDGLDRAFFEGRNDGRRQLAYYESTILVKFLLDRGGQAKLNELLTSLGAGRTIQQALAAQYGLDWKTFNAQGLAAVRLWAREHRGSEASEDAVIAEIRAGADGWRQTLAGYLGRDIARYDIFPRVAAVLAARGKTEDLRWAMDAWAEVDPFNAALRKLYSESSNVTITRPASRTIPRDVAVRIAREALARSTFAKNVREEPSAEPTSDGGWQVIFKAKDSDGAARYYGVRLSAAGVPERIEEDEKSGVK